MKIQYRDIENFVKTPNPAARVILIYGPDHGLMKERANSIAKASVEDVNDPFNVITLSVETLTDSVDGTPILYADDLDIADDGIIYFSDASTKFGAHSRETSPPAANRATETSEMGSSQSTLERSVPPPYSIPEPRVRGEP